MGCGWALQVCPAGAGPMEWALQGGLQELPPLPSEVSKVLWIKGLGLDLSGVGLGPDNGGNPTLSEGAAKDGAPTAWIVRRMGSSSSPSSRRRRPAELRGRS